MAAAQDDRSMLAVERDPYGSAISHYVSPGRDDYIKRAWERPQFIGLLDKPLRFISAYNSGHSSIHVTDIGAGSGEGYDLLVSARNKLSVPLPLHYRALDKSAAMLALMENKKESRLDRRDNLSLIHDDVRNIDFQTLPSDIYLSVGVTYSHLTEDELSSVVANAGISIQQRAQPTVLILDVLGRYSIEWLPLAQSRRRQYSMSFFVQTTEPPTIEMTFYSRGDLHGIIKKSLPIGAKVRLNSLEFHDRSVFVGRHTNTALYNPSVPPIRRVIDELESVHTDSIDLLTNLLLPADVIQAGASCAPSLVRDAITQKSDDWNGAVRSAMARPNTVANLCDKLRQVDQAGPSLGLGHSLTAMLYFFPKS